MKKDINNQNDLILMGEALNWWTIQVRKGTAQPLRDKYFNGQMLIDNPQILEVYLSEHPEQAIKEADLTSGSPDSTNPVHLFLVEENRRLKERIKVLEDALNELKNVSKMYLDNTEKHPDFIMDKDSTITFYFKTATEKATEALNQK